MNLSSVVFTKTAIFIFVTVHIFCYILKLTASVPNIFYLHPDIMDTLLYVQTLLSPSYVAALTNAVCLYNASFLPLISANAFYFHALSLFIDT